MPKNKPTAKAEAPKTEVRKRKPVTLQEVCDARFTLPALKQEFAILIDEASNLADQDRESVFWHGGKKALVEHDRKVRKNKANRNKVKKQIEAVFTLSFRFARQQAKK